MTKMTKHKPREGEKGEREEQEKKDRLKDVLNLEVVVVVLPGREHASEVEDWTFKNGSLNWE